jgi:opacity protein-like surface antigen
MTLVRFLVVAASALAAAGCGSSASSIAPVSGVITLDGKPLANAHVAFQPEATSGARTAGAGSYGTTDASGKYELKTFDTDRAGAVVGSHRVEINLKVVADDGPQIRRPKMLPPKYNLQSELKFKVEPGGTDKADFELKSK